MSSTASQGLRSCLAEPPRALFLKLAPAKVSGHGSDSSWLRNRFFQSPSDTSSSAGENSPEYVHPLTKRRLSMLSEKSLEMCTESLGNETGAHVGEYCVSPAAARGKEPKSVTKKLGRVQSFPPPLKSTGLQVMSRREGGRLVVEAVTAEEWRSVLRVERSEGRIRVEMVRDSEETAAEVDDSGGITVSGGGEDKDGNFEIIEGELGTEKFGRQIRRCMESQRRSNKGLLKQNWDSFLVTTL